jgi:hypothetical protein
VAPPVPALFRRAALLDHRPIDLAVVRDDRCPPPLFLPGPTHVALEGIQDILQPVINIDDSQVGVLELESQAHLEAVLGRIGDARLPERLRHHPVNQQPPGQSRGRVRGGRTRRVSGRLAIAFSPIMWRALGA